MKRNLLLTLAILVVAGSMSHLQADSVTFTGEELLGKPTDQSIAINIIPAATIEYFYQYGTNPGGPYTGQTPPVTATGGAPHEVTITGLNANTRYYYRMIYDGDGSVSDGDYETRVEHYFHTQRAAGSTFKFTVTSDNHYSFNTSFQQAVQNIKSDQPDFHLDLGDTFLPDNATSQTAVDNACLAYREPLYFDAFGHSVPIFLSAGNHENEEGWNFDDTPFSIALASVQARKMYYPTPIQDGFYTGNTDLLAAINEAVYGDEYREDYYAWTWGDALFVVIDPFHYTMNMPYSPAAGEGSDDAVTGDQWSWTLGQQQFNWLKQTLENSDAKYKFMFSHHVTGGITRAIVGVGAGYVRGGAEAAAYFEWGGKNADGSWGFDTYRPGWGGAPIHQLMVANGVSAYFHGHDHQYVYETRDGIVYQEVPSPSMSGSGFSGIYTEGTYSEYSTIEMLPNSGHLRITVTPTQATVDYVRSSQTGVSHTYTILPNTPSTDPIINIAGTPLSSFSSAPGTPSAAQSYTVSGSNLTNNIIITPPSDFEISLTSGSGWTSSSINLVPSGGSVSAATIYVRFNRATEGTSTGNIQHTSSGATQKDVAVSGTATEYTPNPLSLDGPVSSGTGAANATNVSFSHTTGTGTNRLMLVGASWNCGSTNRTISSVTFTPSGGSATALNLVMTQQAGTQLRYSAIYSLLNPPSGVTGTVTITFSGQVSNGIVAGAANFAGVHQTTPLGIPNGAGSTSQGTTPSVTLTGLGGTELVFDNVFQGASGESQTLTAGSGQTQLWNGWISNTRAAASTEQATANSVTMSWTASSSSWWAIAAVPINPASAEPTMPSYNIVLGRPTNNSITLNAIVNRSGEVSFEYGTESGVYGTPTGAVACTNGEPVEVVLNGLASNTHYFYRMRFRDNGAAEWLTGDEHSFRTQRAPGETFTFTLISDSHLGQTFSSNSPARYERATLNVAADDPDFHLDLGDAFVISTDLGVGTYQTGTQAQADAVYVGQRPYFGNFSHSAPVFLAIGNHENEEGWNLDDTPFSRALASIIARKEYFPNPIPGSFYSGNSDLLPAVGGDQYREDYYAWTWGDALFIVLDPFQYTMTKPFGNITGSGEDNDETVDEDQWHWTLGEDQFDWFKQTLEDSDARFKFVFAHHVVGGQLNVSGAAGAPGYVRGGGLAVPYFEWGGYNAVASPTYPANWGFDDERAGWGDNPIHQLMVANHVSAFFHGHDHQFVHELVDDVVYQLVPSPSMTGYGFDLYDASPYVVSGGNLPNAGHIRVTVTSDLATVQYVRAAISGDTGVTNGEISHTYTIAAHEPIAVELASFTVRRTEDKAVAIEWKTAAEINTAGFFIQRSDDKESGFSRLHEQMIKAQGNSAGGSLYKFIDASAPEKECYYRLEEVTLDGGSSFSKPVALSLASSVDEDAQIPLTFALQQNYPNPFNPTTQIDYSIETAGQVVLKIYDLNGRLVKTLVDKEQKEGRYSLIWNGANDLGHPVVSGTYIYRLQAEEKTAVRKMVFLK